MLLFCAATFTLARVVSSANDHSAAEYQRKIAKKMRNRLSLRKSGVLGMVILGATFAGMAWPSVALPVPVLGPGVLYSTMVYYWGVNGDLGWNELGSGL